MANFGLEKFPEKYHRQESNNNCSLRYFFEKSCFIAKNIALFFAAGLILSPSIPFYTPVSSAPLYGGKSYLSVVHFMRQSFSNVRWKIEDMIAEENKVAVRWTCSGTHDGEFMGIKPTGKSFSACVMNFYYFDEAGKIVNDIVKKLENH